MDLEGSYLFASFRAACSQRERGRESERDTERVDSNTEGAALAAQPESQFRPEVPCEGGS